MNGTNLVGNLVLKGTSTRKRIYFFAILSPNNTLVTPPRRYLTTDKASILSWGGFQHNSLKHLGNKVLEVLELRAHLQKMLKNNSKTKSNLVECIFVCDPCRTDDSRKYRQNRTHNQIRRKKKITAVACRKCDSGARF